MRYQRARDILLESEAGTSKVRAFPGGVAIRASRDVLNLINNCDGDHDLEGFLSGHDEATQSAILGAAEKLASHQFLVADGDESPQLTPTQAAWGPAWRVFHHAARDAVFLQAGDEAVDTHLAELKETPQPPNVKSYPDAPVVPLPRVHRVTMSLQDALETRRTHRDFREEPASLDQLSTVLHYSFAPLRFSRTDSWGALQFRASASGGARHEAEPYVVVQKVEGIPQGLYHYNCSEHCLELLQEGQFSDELELLTFGQGMCANTGFTVLLTANSGRLAYKYRHPRAYRILCHNVGHIGQTFAMIATGVGLGAFVTAAFNDAAVEQFLGLDAAGDEFATYVLGAGNPRLRPDGMPHVYESPEPQSRSSHNDFNSR